MTDIRMRLLEQGSDIRLLPVGAVVTWVTTQPVPVPSAGLLLPCPEPIPVPAGDTLTVVGVRPCTGADGWAWQVTVTFNGAVLHQVCVLVPDADVVAFETLTAVDPATLDPLLTPEAAWWGAIPTEAATAASTAVQTALIDHPDVIAAAASLAQSDAGLVRTTDDRLAIRSGDQQVAFAVTDDLGRASWLAADTAGGPPASTMTALNQAGMPLAQTAPDDYELAVVDDSNHLTDLRLGADGRIAADVMADWAARIQALTPGGAVSAPTGLTCAGDSITAGGQGSTDVRWSKLVADHIGLPLWNPSQSGEACFDIAFRSGAMAPVVTVQGGQIGTGTDPVAITAITGQGSPGWRSGAGASWNGQIGHFTGCTLMGVAGTLHHDQVVEGWTFTPTATRGTAVPVPAGTPVYCTAGAARRTDIWIMWPGRNDVDLDRIGQAVEMMRGFLTNQNRFLVLSVLNSSTETTGTSGAINVASVNAGLAATFPSQYVDVLSHLRTSGLSDNGLTVTTQDTADLGNGIIPQTLIASDGVHPNMYGAISIGKYINAVLDQKGWAHR